MDPREDFKKKMEETIATDAVPASAYLHIQWLDNKIGEPYSHIFSRADFEKFSHKAKELPPGKAVKVTFELVDEEV